MLVYVSLVLESEASPNFHGDDAPTLTRANRELLEPTSPRNERRVAERRQVPPVAVRLPGTMMRVEELAARWDVNPKTIYAMIARGELPARRFGRVMRVPRRVVESIESQASVAPGGKKPCR